MTETYERKQTDTLISIGHENLIANVSGFAREVITGEGTKGISIFIPTSSGKTLLDLIKVD